MDRQRSESTLNRYVRNPKSIILPRNKAGDDEKETKKDRKYSKVFCISLTISSILSIIAILIVLLGLALNCDVILKETPNENLTLYNSSYNEFIGVTNFTVNCSEGLIFSKAEQKCVFPCGTFHSCGKTCLQIERIVFTIIITCGIFLSLFNLIAWPCFGSLKSFTHIGIFIITCITLLMVSVLAIPGIPGASVFFCDNTEITVDEVNTRFTVRLHIYGTLYDCLNILTLFWLFFSILNISMVIYFNIGRRTKIAVLITEFCLSILPVIFVVVPIAAGTRYMYSNSYQTAMLQSTTYRYFLQFAPCILLIGAIYILAIGILTFLHIKKISITKFKDCRLELSSLEKRFIFLSILTVIYLIYEFGTWVWLTFVREQIDIALNLHLMCVTLKSPIISNDTAFNGSIFGDVIMPNNWSLTDCQNSSFDQGRFYPGFLDVINHILLRSVWIPTFLLTFPDGLIDLVKKKLTKRFKSEDVIIRNPYSDKSQCASC